MPTSHLRRYLQLHSLFPSDSTRDSRCHQAEQSRISNSKECNARIISKAIRCNMLAMQEVKRGIVMLADGIDEPSEIGTLIRKEVVLHVEICFWAGEATQPFCYPSFTFNL